MSYFFNDNSNQNEIYENEFFYNLGLEFPLSRKVYSFKNKVSYSKEKKIWFIRYKQGNTYIYLFGYNYGNDKQLDTKDPLLILKFDLFNAPRIGNGHFAVDNDADEVRAVMDIEYKNYRSNHKSEKLTSISPIIVDSNSYLDLGNILDSKELCENIELLLDEIESIFFFNRYLNRIKDNTPIKKDVGVKQTVQTIEIKKEENAPTENVKEEIVETSSEVILEPAVKTVNCDFCGSKILDEDPFKICKACRIRISNYLNLLLADFKINTKIPFEDFLHNAEDHNVSRRNIGDITTTLNKYNYLHKINGKYEISYNEELRNFIDKYSTKTENKTDDIENKVILVTEKIGLNTPFDITYLKETLGFKNSEISKMIKYLDEKNAIIEDGDSYILVDKSNEINGINDNLMDTNIKPEDAIKTTQEKITDEQNTETPSIKSHNSEISSIDEKSNTESDSENDYKIEINSTETSDEKPSIELKPINTKNKTDIEIFYELYEKVLAFMKNNVQLPEIASKLGITENRLNAWIEKGKNGQTPYRLLTDGIKKINETSAPTINTHKWKKIIEDIKSGFSVFEASNRANIPYPILQLHITKGRQGKEGYIEFYEDYHNALKGNAQDEIKIHKRCQICNEILSDESKVICGNCEAKKKFAIDLKILMQKLKNNTQFTNENLIVYYNDDEVLKLINNLKDYDLVLEDTSLHIFYFKKENIETFLNTYFDAKDPDYKNRLEKVANTVEEKIKTKKPQKILLSKSQNIPYPFKRLNDDHTFLHPSGSSSKFTLEDVISIHKNYYEDLYSVDEIAKKMGLNTVTIKKLIVRFDAGDFDKFIEILENEKDIESENISICKNCEKEFEPKENEEYCKNCLIVPIPVRKNKFNIILQTEPEILIGTVNDKDFANELCSSGTSDLNNDMDFEDVIDNLKDIIAEKRREEIREIINDEEKPSSKTHRRFIAEDENEVKTIRKIPVSKIKIITSMKKELINGTYSKLKFTGKLPNDKIDSTIMELLNEFKATKRELKLIPISENESQIIFHIITKNSQTTTNMEILRKYGWNLKI